MKASRKPCQKSPQTDWRKSSGKDSGKLNRGRPTFNPSPSIPPPRPFDIHSHALFALATMFVCVCVWFLFRCPFFVAFIGMSCLCWQVVFVCRVIESIVSGSSMRQSSESAFYGVFFAPPPIIFCFFFSGKKKELLLAMLKLLLAVYTGPTSVQRFVAGGGVADKG